MANHGYPCSTLEIRGEPWKPIFYAFFLCGVALHKDVYMQKPIYIILYMGVPLHRILLVGGAIYTCT